MTALRAVEPLLIGGCTGTAYLLLTHGGQWELTDRPLSSLCRLSFCFWLLSSNPLFNSGGQTSVGVCLEGLTDPLGCTPAHINSDLFLYDSCPNLGF